MLRSQKTRSSQSAGVKMGRINLYAQPPKLLRKLNWGTFA
jgi:hypothetical protein